jgi:hypothetical protein
MFALKLRQKLFDHRATPSAMTAGWAEVKRLRQPAAFDPSRDRADVKAGAFRDFLSADELSLSRKDFQPCAPAVLKSNLR